jgi:hypothetical protein
MCPSFVFCNNISVIGSLYYFVIFNNPDAGTQFSYTYHEAPVPLLFPPSCIIQLCDISTLDLMKQYSAQFDAVCPKSHLEHETLKFHERLVPFERPVQDLQQMQC